MTIVLIIIFYILTYSVTANIDCNVRSQLSQQCACINKYVNSTRSCKWSNEKLSYTKTQQEGFIDLRLPNLTTCNSDDYKIRLLINESILIPEMCNKNITSTNWKKHSEIKYKICDLHQYSSSTNNNNKYEKNNSISTVTFDYVFSGCYVLEIFDKTGQLLYQSLPTFITTDYKKKKLVDDDVIEILKPQFRENQGFEITVQMNSTYLLKPPSIYTNLVRNCIACEEFSAVTRVDYRDSNFNECNQTFIPCGASSNITWNCKYLWEVGRMDHICQYTGLTPGNYLLRVSLLDEYTRCNDDATIWANPGNSCDWWANIDIPEIKPNTIPNVDTTTEEEHSIYIIIPIIIIIMLVVVCLCKIKHSKFKQKNQTASEPQNQYGLPLLGAQEILIIYARDSDSFNTMMASFKLLLGSVEKNIRVHDIYVDRETMYVDPENWIWNKISNEDVKVILFLNQCGLIISENLAISKNLPKIAYKSAKWQDDMYPYAIRQLRNSTSRNYTNLFVVEMANLFYNTSHFDDINPGTRYVMPNTMEILLRKIFPTVKDFKKSLLKNFNNHCHKYKEFCEENPKYIDNVLNIE